MQDHPMQAALQAYVNLFRSNMELLGRYSMSPETTTQFTANVQSLLKPGEAGPSSLAQSAACTELMHGAVKNYTVFMAEVAQSGAAMLAQGQAGLVRQTQQATEGFTSTAGRRAR